MSQEETRLNLDYLETVLADIEAIQDRQDLKSSLQKYLTVLGFDSYAFVMWNPAAGARASLYLSSYRQRWIDRYLEMDYCRTDLVLAHAAAAFTPFLWSEITPARFLTPVQAQIFDEAGDVGLNSGGTVPVHGPGGARALLSVANDQPHKEFARHFRAVRHQLQIMSISLHESQARLDRSQDDSGSTFKLTPRELEILTWSANGKTTAEIAIILALSEATVVQHIKNACRKLDTLNKTQAVAVALMAGLIRP